MNASSRFRPHLPLALAAILVGAGLLGTPVQAQEPAPVPESEALLVRPEPPPLDKLESDENGDGVPDGWYNLRDGVLQSTGGPIGPKFIRFESNRPGRPARISRAFGVDGRKYEAVVVGLWVRLERIQLGERAGDEPGLIVDFLGAALHHVSRSSLGPWTTRSLGGHTGWTHVAKRLPVQEATRDAIMSVGLLGATGVLEIDGLSLTLIPRKAATTTNLVRNPDFELGDPAPDGWITENNARRAFPGANGSEACLELAGSGARVLAGLAVSVDRMSSLDVVVKARGQGLRGSGGAAGSFFFLDDDGRIVPASARGIRAFGWSGTFDWREDRQVVLVPNGATRAVFQIEKSDGVGSLRIDDVRVTASQDPEAGTWAPFQEDDDTERWLPFTPSSGIEKGSALDFSFLLDGPAGHHGHVKVKDGRFHFSRTDRRARFFGVQLLPPVAYLEPDKVDALADRLARSGVNLVRLGDIDMPLGPDRSLFDDTRDDTKVFDEGALTRLDHLVAAMKSRGIYVALELQSSRRFRDEDGVGMPGALPPGGGPAALFDPAMVKLATESATALLRRKNTETGVALNEEPALAWVTLAGELSLFDMIDNPQALPGDYAKSYRDLAAKSTTGSGRRFWQGLEAAHWKNLAEALRKNGLKAPVAGSSHWRRELEFNEAQASAGLDLIDDRIYWAGPRWIAPRWRSSLWSLDGGLIADASRKRRPDRPYVLGQWCDHLQGTWASVYDAAEQILAAQTASSEDWDAIVRRGIFLYPDPWGAGAPGTVGGEDIYQLPAVANAAPHVFALWPHASSILLRGHASASEGGKAQSPRSGSSATRNRRQPLPGWEPDRGRLVVSTPYTEGVAGWPGGDEVTLDTLNFDVESDYGVVVASSVGDEPLSRSRRLLVSAVARVEPTGFRWVDGWKRETASPGVTPLRSEPVVATVLWKGKSKVKAFALDNNGARVRPAKVVATAAGSQLVIDGATPSLHWELVAE